VFLSFLPELQRGNHLVPDSFLIGWVLRYWAPGRCPDVKIGQAPRLPLIAGFL